MAPRCVEITVTTDTSGGNITNFQNIFVSRILDQAEGLSAQKFVWGSHFISIWTHVTSVENSTDRPIHIIYAISYQDV